MSEGPKRTTKPEPVGRTMRNGESVEVEVFGPCKLLLTTFCKRTRLYVAAPAGTIVGMPVVLPPAGRDDDHNLDDEEDRR